jgi:hypothetical protein
VLGAPEPRRLTVRAEAARDMQIMLKPFTHQGHGFAPYVMDFKAYLEALAEDDTLSKKARQIMDGLKLLGWGNLSDAPVDAMPAVEPMDRELTQAEMAARLGIYQLRHFRRARVKFVPRATYL